MKNSVFRDAAPLRCESRRLGVMCCLHLQDAKKPRAGNSVSSSADQLLMLFLIRGFFYLTMEATCSSENSILTRLTRHHIPEGILKNKTVLLYNPNVMTQFNFKNVVFWDVTLCGSYKNRRFGEIRVILMMKALSSSETSALTRATRH
jgi:hypothetical protein